MAETKAAIADRAVALANEIQAVITDRETAAVYLAIGMNLGAMEAKAARPDLPALMRIISNVAREEMERTR